MPQQLDGSWSAAFLLSILAIVLFPSLSASSPTPKDKSTTLRRRLVWSPVIFTKSPTPSLTDEQWNPICMAPLLPELAANGLPNYYVGGGRNMFYELSRPPVITTLTDFCADDRGAQCICARHPQTGAVYLDCLGHFGVTYQAYHHCVLECNCGNKGLPPNPFEVLRDRDARMGLLGMS